MDGGEHLYPLPSRVKAHEGLGECNEQQGWGMAGDRAESPHGAQQIVPGQGVGEKWAECFALGRWPAGPWGAPAEA